MRSKSQSKFISFEEFIKLYVLNFFIIVKKRELSLTLPVRAFSRMEVLRFVHLSFDQDLAPSKKLKSCSPKSEGRITMPLRFGASYFRFMFDEIVIYFRKKKREKKNKKSKCHEQIGC